MAAGTNGIYTPEQKKNPERNRQKWAFFFESTNGLVKASSIGSNQNIATRPQSTL